MVRKHIILSTVVHADKKVVANLIFITISNCLRVWITLDFVERHHYLLRL